MAATESISYDLGRLSNCENRLLTVSRNLSEIRRTLKQISDSSYSYWEGTASDEFHKQSASALNSLEQFKTKVDTAKQNLTDSIAVYQKTETDNKKLVDNLSTENIF